MPIDQIKLRGQIRNDGILHFNVGNQLDWRKVGAPYWQQYFFQMRSTSNTIRLDPQYSSYFTGSTVAQYNPANQAAANTCVMLVSGSQFGQVYIAGNNNGHRIFNPTTNTYTVVQQQTVTPAINTNVIQTCVLMYNGMVLQIPASTVGPNPGDPVPPSVALTYYNPEINRIQRLNTVNFTRSSTDQAPDYWASIMLPQPPGTTLTAPGSVFLPPYSGENALIPFSNPEGRGYYPAIYDFANDRLVTIKTTEYNSANTGASTRLYRDCCLLPSGRIFMVPYNATNAAIYDPVTTVTTFVPHAQFGGGRFYHGVTLNDGRVFCGRYNANNQASVIFDERANSVTTTIPLLGRLRKPILLPDNRVFCIPFARQTDAYVDANGTPSGTVPPLSGSDVLKAAIYDPSNNTATYFDIIGISSTGTSTVGGNSVVNISDFYRAGAMLFDGKVFIPVGSASRTLKFGSINYSFDWNILASPYHNGR